MSVYETVKTNASSQNEELDIYELKPRKLSIAYEGYFNNGCFYVNGSIIQIPEQYRVVITILESIQPKNEDSLNDWKDIKQMIADSSYENHLPTDDVFSRDKSSRDIPLFENRGND